MDGLALYDSAYSTAINSTGSTISKGRRLVIAKASDGTLSMTLAGNSVVGDAVSVEDIPTAEIGKIRWWHGVGLHQIEAGGAITANAAVTADTNGRISTGGGTAIGRSIDAAATGSYLNVIPA